LDIISYILPFTAAPEVNIRLNDQSLAHLSKRGGSFFNGDGGPATTVIHLNPGEKIVLIGREIVPRMKNEPKASNPQGVGIMGVGQLGGRERLITRRHYAVDHPVETGGLENIQPPRVFPQEGLERGERYSFHFSTLAG